MMDVHNLPALNACLNGVAGIFLFLGWMAIKKKNRILHKKMMICAFITSTLFLCSYLTYHFLVHGLTQYKGQGFLRQLYFFILLTHTPLAVIIVPFCLKALWHAYKQDFQKHIRITRWLLPVWMYVSLTGVLIYLMLYTFKGRGDFS